MMAFAGFVHANGAGALFQPLTGASADAGPRRARSRVRERHSWATICACGFGESRASTIIALAKAVARRRPLASLRALSDEQLKDVLVRLPGIGVKTARVIAAMSALERNRFAVDTHV